MAKYAYNDIVRVSAGSIVPQRIGERAWIVGFSPEEERTGAFLQRFPKGMVYTIEFEDGSSVEVPEDDLELVEKNPDATS
jgi:hypothetical protein